ncbi:MAG: heme lyase CcmF/NrfE family subunit [Alphaproteobacteria bacterium]|jgi:cytochrome c-type biogenesis protein CcmF|nr:heme lyase CcmF/NrfE family subunit [Alphaproteobacteria bacterium]
MILAYTGQAFLGIALLLAALQTVGPARYISTSRFSYGQALFVSLAFGLLLYAHVTDQFALLSVALHSHTEKPLLYKISGVWGNHEGSMLLWVLILSVYGAVVARQVKRLEAPYPLAAPLMAFMNFGFLLFVLMACDPFTIADPAPLQGQDLNPLLQDPSLAIHPPILYIGYAGFAVPFVFAVAALIYGKVPDLWADLMRPWILFAWTFLTLGVGLGSFWAYYELGWGGWWFWDPVENAALMPWLTATALLHTVVALKATKTLQAGTLFLSILTFALCLFGTFLVRSGLLTSVHNFAVDPERGAFIFILSSLLILPALGLFFWRLPKVRSIVSTIPLSRSGLILLMMLFLVTGTATVALGTLYPLILEAFGQKMTVGAPYFNATFVPMMLPLLVLLGLGPWYSWPAHGLASSAVRWLLPLSCVTMVVFFVACLGFGVRHILGLAAFTGAVWTIFATVGYALKKKKILSGTILGHLGIGIAVLGMVGSSLGEQEVIKAVKVGETFSVGPVSLMLQQVTTYEGQNYKAQQANLQINPGGATLTPEKRFYWTQGVIHGESAIRSVGFGWLHHIYVMMGEEYEGQKWSIHAYYKPFMNLLWVGGLMVVLGGIVAFRKRFQGLKKVLPLMMVLWHPILGMGAHEQLSNPSLEIRARLLSRKILCPACQGQILDESPVESAAHLRSRIRQALRGGQTDDQILEGLMAQYGAQVVATPPVTWATYALWFGPWVLFGFVLGGWFIRKRRSPIL